MTAPDMAAGAAAPQRQRTVPVNFSGRNMEYLKLWLVNLLLSIITLGIYSAWAKVRNNQYLYGHTQIEGHRFHYLAKPMQILRGRIIAVIFFVMFTFLSNLNPAFGGLMMLLLLILMPWLIVQGLKFTLRNSAYRGVRFSFEGSYLGVLAYMMLMPVIGVITLGLAMPWVAQQMQKYLYENATYGGRHFSLPTSAGEYYKATLLCIGIVFFAIVAAIIAVSALGLTAILAAGSDPEAMSSSIGEYGIVLFIAAYIAVIALYMFLIYLVSAVYQGMIRNHIFNCLNTDGIFKTHSDIRLLPFTGMMLSNALIILFTLGLGYPITRIRKQRFLAAATSVTLEPAIDHLVNTVEATHSAFGEEAAGLFDLDLSLT